ncbi:MAG: hypothetical protein ACOCP8_06240 [archaeon]
MEKHKNKFYWNLICKYQNLSKKFIEKHKNKLDWNLISKYQNLSEDFIEKYKNKVNWFWISSYQNLSKKFRKKYNLGEQQRVFVKNCGVKNRIIHIKKNNPNLIWIGCFEGTQKEAIKAVKKKYKNHKLKDDYINKINQCFKLSKKIFEGGKQ